MYRGQWIGFVAAAIAALAPLGANASAFNTPGNILITDQFNNRSHETVFACETNTGPGSNANPNSTGALRLLSGNTIIADQLNNRVIIVDAQCNIRFQYGETNVVGNGPNRLSAPYSAVVIGQDIGVTPPLATKF